MGEKLSEGWYKVVYRGTTGYMSSEFNFSENLEGTFGNGTIFGTGVRLRETAQALTPMLSACLITNPNA